MMKNSTLLKFGIGGTIIAALCCFTPILVLLLGAVGAAAWIGYLDYVLFPALFLFIGLTIYASQQLRKEQACCTQDNAGEKP